MRTPPARLTTDPEEALRQIEGAEAEAEDTVEMPAVTTLSIDVKDERGKRYVHKFYYRVPTLGDQIKIGQIKQAMLPGGSPDVNANVLVDTLAYLQVCITFNDQYPKPSWWKPNELHTATPFSALYGRCLDYEAKFHSGDAVNRDDGSAARGENASGGAGEPAVGRKIQPPAKRRETLAGDPEGSP